MPQVGGGWGSPSGMVSTDNSTAVALTGAATYTGTWEDVSPWASITINGAADVAGTIYADFSADGVTTDRTVQLSSGLTSTWQIHGLAPVNRFFRVRVVNGADAQSTLVVQTLYHRGFRAIWSRASQVVNDYTDVLNMRLLTDVYLDEANGRQSDRSVVSKFGRNPAVGAGTDEDIWTDGGLYTGWLTTAATVRIKAGGNAADAAAGLGAQKVMVSGLDETWAYAEEEITCNADGTLVSAATTTTFIRVNQAYVTESGTYSDANTAAMVIETSGGVTVADIGIVNGGGSRGLGQSQLAMYTVPLGKVGFIRRIAGSVDGTKATDVFFWQRQNADDATTPFTAPRIIHAESGLSGPFEERYTAYKGPFPAKTDLWASALGGNGGPGVSAEFDVVLVNV